MELAPVENVAVETTLKEIAGVAAFIAKLMSENENLKTKLEEVTTDNENLKTKLEDQTTDNEFLKKQVVDLTGEKQKLFEEREEEIIKRNDNEEELKLAETKSKELGEKLRECRANELKYLDTISELLETNACLKNKGREIATKGKQQIKRVTKENALLTIENVLFKKFEEKRNNDGKHILEDLARLKKITTQFSFYKKRASKRELFNRIADGVKESIMSGCIE